MKPRTVTANDLPSRSKLGHCSNDSVNEIRERFFQIWSHKAVNISNDLIEYTIRRLQSDRLRFLFRTRHELTHQENVLPFCPISVHIEDDLQQAKEQIRRFCLTTRNVYRHLRSDSRLYPKMSINLDRNIVIKICRFIFKTKVLIKIFTKGKHLSNTDDIKQMGKKFDLNDPFRNITKAFIVLQSNFEILHGDILDRDFFQNAKTAVQTLPIILDTSKTIRLIFCALHKLNEPERRAEAEAIRQRRLAFGPRGCGLQKTGLIMRNSPVKKREDTKLQTVKEMLKINQPPVTKFSMNTPTKTLSSSSEILPNKKLTSQLKTKTTSPSKTNQSSKSKSPASNTKVSNTKKSQLSPSSATKKTKNNSPQKSPSTVQKKSTSPNLKSKSQKKSKNKNKNSSKTDLTSSNESDEETTKRSRKTNSSPSQTLSQGKHGWTTWLHIATRSLDTILPTRPTNLNTKPLLTTWASVDRISKI